MDGVETIVVNVVLPVVAALVSWAAVYATRKLGKLLNIKAISEYHGDVERLATQAVMSAKGRARQWAKKQNAPYRKTLNRKSRRLEKLFLDNDYDGTIRLIGAAVRRHDNMCKSSYHEMFQ